MEDLEKRALELKREYFRNWRKNNREKVKETTMNYWIRKAQEENEQNNK